MELNSGEILYLHGGMILLEWGIQFSVMEIVCMLFE